MSDGLKYGELTQQIIGAAFDVHGFLGSGFQEVIYQRALAHEFSKAKLSFAREIEQDIYYQTRRKTSDFMPAIPGVASFAGSLSLGQK